MSVMEGSLSKWTNVVKGWQYRWFVLDENAGLLSYYTSKEKMMRGVRRGCVRLKGAIIGIDDEDDSTFTITVDHKTFHFQARDAEERESWVRALEDTILRHVFRMKWECNRTQPSIADFDNKVAEADAYLQIMIDQTKTIEEQIPNITDLEEQEKYKMLQDQSNTMLDNIKHSIVLLQIAKNQMIVEQFKVTMNDYKQKKLKNTAYPVNGIYQGPTPRLNSPVRNTGFSPSSSQMGVQTGIELATDCMGPQKSATSPIILVVPETSYSSSEGEDDFYDANDSPFTSSQVQSPTGVRVFSNENETTATSTDNSTNEKVEIHNSVSDTLSESNNLSNENVRKVSTAFNERTSLPLNDDGSINYDALYDEDIEEDSSLMEAHGSVITHLISQIKIGMDLTKVVLPTFILERRSLLEMYADYFAHPDLFVSIADLKDPKSRMVQVVKWYMASYHAGRKSSVAKKPYNPILGEVFKCWWDLPQSSKENSSPSLNHSTITTSTSDQNVDTTPPLVTDGPVPWGTRDQLTFAAEQVSHHPPISAFYAEHYNKRISFCAHVYTKSKFLGLSVCVYNIGQGKIKLLEYNEEYTVTFPNGYGRSILTVPWIELGGQVKIECPQTNYHADVEFLTKPFYSNKKHRITADVYSPNDKIPFLKVSGEWNGVMEAKWNDGRTETFIDVNKLTVVKKKVKPISQQEDNESRRLWKDVTAGLRFNNIEQATQAKSNLEQKQRNEAKERLRTNDKWETKLFQPEGECWTYITPLSDRTENKL